jgi:outer membrane protein OmpA-like peptidoglycan-associated protein
MQNSLDIIIRGHTDTVGTLNYSRNLSLNRARTASNILAAKGVAGKLSF